MSNTTRRQPGTGSLFERGKGTADECAAIVARHATEPEVELRRLLRHLLVSYWIGNGDLHGKNLSIFNPDGIWQPTPAYDLLSTQPYTGWKDPMALNLFGRANRLNRNHFLDAAARLGLRERAVAKMVDGLIDGAEPWPQRCGDIGFDDRQTTLLADMLRARIDTLR